MVKKTDFSVKITEIEGKIPSISGLATNSTLTAVENKIPDVSSLVKKTDYNTKIIEIEYKDNDHNHDKYITTPEFNSMVASVFNARLAQADLVKKTDFDAKLKGISDRVTSNKSKQLLVENELKKLKTFDLSYFGGKNYFEGDNVTQNVLVFQVKEMYFEDQYGSTSNAIRIWNSKGISKQSLHFAAGAVGDLKMSKAIKPASGIFNKESGYLLQKNSDIIASGSIVNTYIVYRLSLKTISSSNALKNSLFGATEATKPNNTTDSHKYNYSGYGTTFDRTE